MDSELFSDLSKGMVWYLHNFFSLRLRNSFLFDILFSFGDGPWSFIRKHIIVILWRWRRFALLILIAKIIIHFESVVLAFFHFLYDSFCNQCSHIILSPILPFLNFLFFHFLLYFLHLLFIYFFSNHRPCLLFILFSLFFFNIFLVLLFGSFFPIVLL